jgi:ClpX C4-type zinc finger
MDNSLKKVDEEDLFCSFCKKKKSQVSLLISGEGAPHICEGCIVNSFNLAVKQGAIQESNVIKLYRKSVMFFLVIVILLSIITIHIFNPSLFGFLIK